jgi:hypothetical protein
MIKFSNGETAFFNIIMNYKLQLEVKSQQSLAVETAQWTACESREKLKKEVEILQCTLICQIK